LRPGQHASCKCQSARARPRLNQSHRT
jgi:hypothetical protein